MRKFIYGLMFVMLALQGQAHAQTVIKQCPDGSTVGGNSQCPSQGRRTYYREARPDHTVIVYSKSARRFYSPSYEEREWGVWSHIEREMKKACNKEHGANDCETVFHVRTMCSAVAEGKKYYATAFGRDEKQAADRALYTCQGTGDVCKVSQSKCP